MDRDQLRERLVSGYDPSNYDGLYKVSHQLWFKILSGIFGPCCGFLFSVGILIPAFIYSIDNWDSNCEHPLDKWLLVTAIILSVQASFYLCKVASALCDLKKKDDDEEKNVPLCSICYSCCLCIFVLFWVAWYIIGTVWLFGSETNDACPESLWNCVLVVIIIFYCVLGLGVLLCCTACISFCFCVCCLPADDSYSPLHQA
eukprot:TRINITY_DN3732_c0_g1_i1.p1 TRINITY_DN3732_c0_g1~~TRINITY_DN3732_c0_g1_i1.p1  ORF type:complete len:201 (+),score=7.59 TRINITY_DN3732_c0_g1_i1:47-649(+)